MTGPGEPGGYGGGHGGGLGGGYGGGYGGSGGSGGDGYDGTDRGRSDRSRPQPGMAEPRERHREPRAEQVTPPAPEIDTVQDPVVLHHVQRPTLEPVEVFARVDPVVAELLPQLLSGFADRRIELWRRPPGGEWTQLPFPPPPGGEQ